MKSLDDYKKLAPYIMGSLLVLCIFGRVKAAHDDTSSYEEHLTAARNYKAQKIYATAYEEYQAALEMEDSLELDVEIGELLEEEGNETKIENWCDEMIEKYPTKSEVYEHYIKFAKSELNYSECFSLYNIAKRRGIMSEAIEDEIASIRYEYLIDIMDYEEVSDYVSDYAVVKEGDLYGLVSSKNESVIKEKYVDMSACDGNYVAVTDENGESYYIDLNDDRRFNFPEGIKPATLGKIYEDIIPVENEGKTYYYSASEGVQLLGPYEEGKGFSHGVAAIREGDSWYLISTDGTRLTDNYKGFYMNSGGEVAFCGRVFALTDKGYVMLNEDLAQVNSAVYEDVQPFVDDTYAAVKVDGKWGFIDKDGNFKIKPKFENAYSFAGGLAPAFENGLWGYIDVNGRWAVEPYFIDAKGLSKDGCGFVKEPDSLTWSTIKFYEYNYD